MINFFSLRGSKITSLAFLAAVSVILLSNSNAYKPDINTYIMIFAVILISCILAALDYQKNTFFNPEASPVKNLIRKALINALVAVLPTTIFLSLQPLDFYQKDKLIAYVLLFFMLYLSSTLTAGRLKKDD